MRGITVTVESMPERSMARIRIYAAPCDDPGFKSCDERAMAAAHFGAAIGLMNNTDRLTIYAEPGNYGNAWIGIEGANGFTFARILFAAKTIANRLATCEIPE